MWLFCWCVGVLFRCFWCRLWLFLCVWLRLVCSLMWVLVFGWFCYWVCSCVIVKWLLLLVLIWLKKFGGSVVGVGVVVCCRCELLLDCVDMMKGWMVKVLVVLSLNCIWLFRFSVWWLFLDWLCELSRLLVLLVMVCVSVLLMMLLMCLLCIVLIVRL